MAAKKIDTEKIFINSRFGEALKRIDHYPLTVLEAPSGYGKTTGLKSFLEKTEAEHIWIDAVPCSEEYMWECLCSVLARIDVSLAEAVSKKGFPCGNEDVLDICYLIKAADVREKIFVVIDDYHNIYSERTAKFIMMAAKSAVPWLGIILSGRRRFEMCREELAVKHFLHIVDASVIRMNSEDIRKYYEFCGCRITSGQAERLFEITDGWTAALYLILVEGKGKNLTEIPGRIYSLLEQVACAGLDEDRTDLLQRISVFRSFTLDQAYFIRRKNDPRKALEKLVSGCVFIYRDPDSRIYYINTIFADLFRSKLDKRSAVYRNEVYRSAADWHYLEHDYGRAADLYFRSGLYDEALGAYEKDKGVSIIAEDTERIKKALYYCPEDVLKKHPYALMLFARNLSMAGEREISDRIRAGLDKLADMIDDPEEKDMITGELYLLDACIDYGDIAVSEELFGKARKCLAGTSRLISRKSIWCYGAPSLIYMFHTLPGRLDEEAAELTGSRSLYCGLTDGNSRGSEYLFMAEAAFFRGELEQADILSNKALSVASKYEQTNICISAGFLHMKISLMKGDTKEGVDSLNKMRKFAGDSILYKNTIEVCEAAIYAIFNQVKYISPWIEDGSFLYEKKPGLYDVTLQYLSVVYGKILLNKAEYSGYLGISQFLKKEAQKNSCIITLLYLNLFDAVAYRKMGLNDQAEESMRKAVSYAADDGIVIPFVENGNSAGELLKKIKWEKKEKSFVEKCGRISRLYEKNLNAVLVSDKISPLSILTRREREISLLVADGKTNMQIAKELNIAEITVKKTLSNIYERLGITNRTSLIKKISR